MPKVPEHSVVWRRSDQPHLAVKHQNAIELDDSAILIKMLSAGVCGTDLAILSGSRPGAAEVLGHEGVGVVLDAPDHCGVSRGTRVIINPVHRNHPELVIGHSHDGVFREFFWLDAAVAAGENLLVACPSDCTVSETELVLAEPVASVLYSMELLRQHSGESSLLIRGSGTVGILAAKLWSTLTGSPAILVSKSQAHSKWLQESTDWPANVRICCVAELPDAIHENGGPAFNAAVLCCSRQDAPDGLRLLLDFVVRGATIDLMAGFPAEYREARLGGFALDRIRWNNICGASSAPRAAVVDRATGKSVYLTGHRGTAERHIAQAVELLSKQVISTSQLPHRFLTLPQLPEVVDMMLPGKNGRHTEWIKAIVTFA